MQKHSLLLTLFISSCCSFTSQDCNCEPPSPDLTVEAQKWLLPYRDDPSFFFETEDGEQDTLTIVMDVTTEFCGGDECGTQCELINVKLISARYVGPIFTVVARENNLININYTVGGSANFQAELNVNSLQAIPLRENLSASTEADFSWNGQQLTVFGIDCVEDCFSLGINHLLISKEEGPLEYFTVDNREWKRVE